MLSRIQVVRVKSERAKKHLHDLDIILDAFFKSDPYKVGFKDDIKAGERTFYMTKVSDISPGVFAVTGDYLAYQLVLANRETPTGVTSFPIADSASEYVTPKFGRKVKGMGQEAIKRINAIKPYQGGNDLLWKLGKLNNRDKHRVLIAGASSNLGHTPTKKVREKVTAMFLARHPNAKNMASNIFHSMYFPTDCPFPLKVGQELLTWPIAELDEYVQFRFDVAFNETKVCEREPVLETLKRMSDLVDWIIGRFPDLL